MTKVENGYSISDEEYNLMLEKLEELDNGLNKLSEMLAEMLKKMEKSLEDTEREIEEIKRVMTE